MRYLGFGLLYCGLWVAAACLIPNPAHSAGQAPAPSANGQPALASHRAIYSISLKSVRPGADYIDVDGAMAIDFKDVCDAWTTNQKSTLRTVTSDGAEDRSDSEFNAWESKDGAGYNFSMKQNQGGEATEYRGHAKRNAPSDSGVADYTKPDREHFKLPAHFLFQTAQQIKLLEFARKGDRFLSGDIFDGSEGGGAARFNAVILKPAIKPATASLKNPLLDAPAYRVRVAFYLPEGTLARDESTGKLVTDSGEEPEYEVTMTIHDNGVVSDYDYDYDDFSVHGTLRDIQASSRPHC
jgi:hypothetical protein